MVAASAYIDKVTVTGPAPYGGSYSTTATDWKVQSLVAEGWRITRQWTVAFHADGSIEEPTAAVARSKRREASGGIATPDETRHEETGMATDKAARDAIAAEDSEWNITIGSDVHMSATQWFGIAADDPDGMYSEWFAQMGTLQVAIDRGQEDAMEGLTLLEQADALERRLTGAIRRLRDVARETTARHEGFV